MDFYAKMSNRRAEGKVKNLKAYSSCNAVILKWDSFSGASGYEVWRSVKRDTGYAKIKTVRDTIYADKVPESIK